MGFWGFGCSRETYKISGMLAKLTVEHVVMDSVAYLVILIIEHVVMDSVAHLVILTIEHVVGFS